MDAPEDRQKSIGSEDVFELLRLLWMIDHCLGGASKRMLLECGVTGPQRLVIWIVGRYPGIAAGRIAEILHVHPSTLTEILARLIDRRILTRHTDLKDRRRALFKLTAAGEELYQLPGGSGEAKILRVMRRMGAIEVAATRRVLAAVAECVEARPRRGG